MVYRVGLFFYFLYVTKLLDRRQRRHDVCPSYVYTHEIPKCGRRFEIVYDDRRAAVDCYTFKYVFCRARRSAYARISITPMTAQRGLSEKRKSSMVNGRRKMNANGSQTGLFDFAAHTTCACFFLNKNIRMRFANLKCVKRRSQKNVFNHTCTWKRRVFKRYTNYVRICGVKAENEGGEKIV